MASVDRQGSVYIEDHAVYRVIPFSHVASVTEVLEIVAGSVVGVIDTSVPCEDALPPGIEIPNGSLTLKHRRVVGISYPHEWCAKMLQDAAVFHLDLSETLFQRGLMLKDAHPWNVLFEKGSPVFVDFTSLVTTESLFAEDYLNANREYGDAPTSARLSMLVHEIYRRMFQPYFINPLMFYECGERHRVRPRIENTTLNASSSTITVRECMPKARIGRSVLKKLLQLVKSRRTAERAFAKLRETADIKRFYEEMRTLVQSLRVSLGGSAYSAYYQIKGEVQPLIYSSDWNAKQKSVHSALASKTINSVLDVACNTGWFALMAEKLGKHVIAFDVDEGCIEALYDEVKHSGLNILPLVMDFTELTQDRYSTHDGRRVVINAAQRLRADSVLALGIIHHLALGLGLSFDEILDSLVSLCNMQLVIEFVERTDEMIQNEPSFFPFYYKNNSVILDYDIGKFITRIECRGFKVNILPSHPNTRTILICERYSQQ